MVKYVTGKNGRQYSVDFSHIIEREKASRNGEGITWVFVAEKDNIFSEYCEHRLQVYYRHERTWDDHMGNTPCGYYCNVPLPDGSTRRVYMF